MTPTNHPRRVLQAQLTIIVVLTAANLAVHLTFLQTGHNHIFGLRHLFDLDGEWNIPAVYSALVILACGSSMGAIAVRDRQRQRRDSPCWLFLAAVFLYLAYDELFSIHESLRAPSLGGAVGHGLLHIPWVVPGAVFVLAVLTISLAFLRRLPAPTRRLMLMAGATYVTGAIGFESLSGWRFDTAHLARAPGRMDLPFLLLFTAEEFLEMLGMALCLFAVLQYDARGR